MEGGREESPRGEGEKKHARTAGATRATQIPVASPCAHRAHARRAPPPYATGSTCSTHPHTTDRTRPAHRAIRVSTRARSAVNDRPVGRADV